MRAGRFVLVFVGFQEGMDTPDDGYVTSWDTWAECEVAFPKGRLPVGYRLDDTETGRVWQTGAKYEWEDART